MLSKCANPECTAAFHYLREGRLFQIDTAIGAQAGGPQLVGPAHRIEYFWLCPQCSSNMTLAFQRGKGVVMIPLQRETVRRAVAS